MTASVRAVLRDHAVSRLVGVPDEQIPVACTVDSSGFHLFTAAVPCADPRCVAVERDREADPGDAVTHALAKPDARPDKVQQWVDRKGSRTTQLYDRRRGLLDDSPGCGLAADLAGALAPEVD
ncbi:MULTISPECIES: hypothetical protein [unclassified Streptomyces]|uniref:hypothetical protein n=1 Tax=unclassified Streptomyces TaxID=2593676 RepID=UPI00382C9975